MARCPTPGCPCGNGYSHNSHILAARLHVKASRNLKRDPDPEMVTLSKEETYHEQWLREVREDGKPIKSYTSLTEPTLSERIRNAWKGFTRG